MAQIEIKYDESTLPKDGQKVRYRNLDTLEWKEGIYIASDQQFHTSSTDFEFVDMVDVWEAL